MKIVTADITGSLIVNGVDVTNNVVSSSVFSGSIAGRVTNLEQFSSSLDATFATDASVTASILVLSQSVQVSQAALSSSYALTSGSFVVTSGSYAAASASLSTRVTNTEATASTNTQASASFAAYSGSMSTRLTTDETNITTLTNASASFAVESASLSIRVTNLESTSSTVSSSFASTSGSLSTRVTNLESTSSTVSSSFATTSGSIAGRVTIIEGQDATTGSNIFTGPQFINQASNAISFTSTASLYTDGGLRVSKDSYVSGTAYFNNVVVYGTSSIQYITSSQVNFGTNIITVNTDTPAVRFGGLAVFDSGSTQLTGSMLWDSEKNHWIYSNPSGSSYNSAMLMNGPRNTGSLGTEQGTTACAMMIGQGGDHITSSMIYSYGNATCFYGTSYVSASGDTCFAGTVCAPSFVGGTMSGATIYGSTAVCSPVGKFTTCIDAGSGTFSGNLTLSNGSLTINKSNGNAQLYFLNNGSGDWDLGTQVGDATQNFSLYNRGTSTQAFYINKSNNSTFFYSTITGTTIYGSTAVCSPVGKFTTCLDLGGALTGTSAVFSSSVQVGAGTYSSGLAKLYTDSTYGTILTGKSGSSSDMLLTDRSGNIALQIVANGATPNVVIGNNLGLNFTPSATGTNARALQLTNYGTISGNGNIGSISLAANAYESADNCWNRVNATSAGLYQISYTGQHTWSYTGASTANSAITWTQAMLLNNSGNLGLGVTPSIWTLGKAIEIGNLGHAIWSVNASQYNIMYNTYYNGGFVYASSNPASYYQQASGNHTWYNAPSGTAGCAITFCPAMTINACSRLLVGSGVTDNGASIQTNGDIRADYFSAIYLQINGGAAGDYRKGFSGVNQETGVARGLHIFNYDPDSSQGIKFFGGTYAAKVRFGGFDSGGNFFVNATDSAEGYKFYVNGTAGITGAATFSSSVTATSFSTSGANSSIRGGDPALFRGSAVIQSGNSITFDAFRFLNPSGGTGGSASSISGRLYMTFQDTSTGGNQASYQYLIFTTGNGVSPGPSCFVQLYCGPVRGTNPISSISLVNDGSGGAVKVQATTAASSVAGAIAYITFVGTAV